MEENGSGRGWDFTEFTSQKLVKFAALVTKSHEVKK